MPTHYQVRQYRQWRLAVTELIQTLAIPVNDDQGYWIAHSNHGIVEIHNQDTNDLYSDSELQESGHYVSRCLTTRFETYRPQGRPITGGISRVGKWNFHFGEIEPKAPKPKEFNGKEPTDFYIEYLKTEFSRKGLKKPNLKQVRRYKGRQELAKRRWQQFFEQTQGRHPQ
jgi:hypothetical protein